MNSEQTDKTASSILELWTYREAAQFLRRSESQLRHDVQLKRIPCYRVGRQIRFSKSQLESWIKSKEIPARGHK
jgi:excisionase family DNA binding protein